jgi:hypothetical protein
MEFSQIPEIESLTAIIYTLPKSQFMYNIFSSYMLISQVSVYQCEYKKLLYKFVIDFSILGFSCDRKNDIKFFHVASIGT